MDIALLAFRFQVYATRGKEGIQEEKEDKVQSASCSKQTKTDLEGAVNTQQYHRNVFKVYVTQGKQNELDQTRTHHNNISPFQKKKMIVYQFSFPYINKC